MIFTILNPGADLPLEAAQGEEGARGDRRDHPDRFRLRRPLWQQVESWRHWGRDFPLHRVKGAEHRADHLQLPAAEGGLDIILAIRLRDYTQYGL